jgi:hypothetical protein
MLPVFRLVPPPLKPSRPLLKLRDCVILSNIHALSYYTLHVTLGSPSHKLFFYFYNFPLQ